MTISATYRLLAPDAPPISSPAVPYSRHSRRNARFVMPAIGARTTGESMTWRPMCSGGSTGVEVGAVVTDMAPPILARPGPWV